jgi:transposase-like protein
MDPQTVFCPNSDCPARGQVGQGNITIHSQKEQRYKCNTCGQTFAATKGTPFYRLRTGIDTVCIVITLLAHGCPIQAIVAAFGFDERTVKEWHKRAGEHCEQVHTHLVQGQPRDLGQVQADEIRVKVQGGIVWMALAIMVSTRLWLGGVVSVHRDRDLIVALVRQVRACALCRPLLLCVDGLISYVRAFQQAFRTPLRTGKQGRPRLIAWPDINIAQVVKQYQRRRVIGVVRRIVQGTEEQVRHLLKSSQSGGMINTAYIERLNGTFRQRMATLIRRGRALARHPETLHGSMYLIGTVYNFCTHHRSLRVAISLPRNRRHWVHRTPAMAARITDHRWTAFELLSFRIPPPPFVPPKRRGRPPKVANSAVAL